MSHYIKEGLFSRFKIPDVTERLRKDSEGRSLASNLVFTIWAVFGGFILHFLLSNYLSVLLKPSYEQPVDTTKDLIERDIIPFTPPGTEYLVEELAASPDPEYQELAKRLYVTEDWDEYYEYTYKVTTTGKYADIGSEPLLVNDTKYTDWYRSTDILQGDYNYVGHLLNKKWPLRKVSIQDEVF